MPALKPKSVPVPQPRRLTPWWVKAFVWFHLSCVLVWTLPVRAELLKDNVSPVGTDWLLALNGKYIRPLPPVKAYLFGSGFWQYWDMFAPNPSNVDTYGDALVRFKDGSEKVYWYPRIHDLPIPGKLPMERYRKFYERAGSEESAYLWIPFAQTIARNYNTDPQNPPVRVDLRYYKRPVAPPSEPQAVDYVQTTYFRYVVDPLIFGRPE